MKITQMKEENLMPDTTKDGGQAFPTHGLSGLPNGEFIYPEHGMSLRDYFAAKALSLGGEFFHNLGNGCDTPPTVAEAAYQLADAMLKERAR